MSNPQLYSKDLHSPQYLCTELGLYGPIDISNMSTTEYKWLKRHDHSGNTIDTYCLQCEQDSVFQCRGSPLAADYSGLGLARSGNSVQRRGLEEAPPPVSYVESDFVDDFAWEIACTRSGCGCKAHFYFHIAHANLAKVGQWPSIADLRLPEIQRYRGLLGDTYRELARAIGLHSHGIGVGSFVYLRRIFESLIQDTYSVNKSELDCTQDEFLHMHMDQRIACLSDYLPDFLVQNASVYEILSKEIHELSDDECLGCFGIVRDGIELILSEQLQKLETEKRQNRLSTAIGDLTGSLRRRQDY